MDNFKVKKIKSLKDEVKDFHPVLMVLLKVLPGIKSVEYTHGPQEMGADFVLTKSDETLDDMEYIGCIVKVGQIKQDHSDIIRQIDECEIERKVEGGIRKIFLSEIWIISNSNITNGAQEKIHYKYKNKNIKFLSGERIASLVDKFYPEYWTDVSVQMGEYLRGVKMSSDSISRNNSLMDFSSSDIYIPQQLLKQQSQKSVIEGVRSKAKKVSLERVLEKENLIVVEAMMGTGKSTLIAQLAKHYSCEDVFSESNVLPFLIRAAEVLKKHDGDLSGVISDVTQGGGFEGVDRYVIFIDGLDEIRLSGAEVLSFLERIYTSANSNAKIKVVVTTRSIDDPVVESEVGKMFARYKLCALSVRQVISLVDQVCKKTDIKTRLLKDLDKSQLFKVLPKTPISAILLAKLLNENVQEVPSSMTDLYSKFMELCLGRWDMDKGLQSQQEYDIIYNVTISTAIFMMDNSLSEVSLGDVKGILYDYCDSRNLKKINKENVFDKMIFKVEIFVQNKSKGTISFRHRTFSEYFYAAGLNRDNSAHIDESIYDFYWATTYFFYVGIKRDCPSLLKAINDIEFTSDQSRILKVFHDGNFLLAAYLTPYDVVKESVFGSFRNTAELYSDTTTAVSDNPLNKLSSISLLCVFTNALCETFGYEYFSEALSERAYELCTLANPSDLDYTELFLINSVQLSIGKPDSYDTLVENYGKNIPIPIQAAMIEHAGYENSVNKVVKNLSKRFKKNFRSNRAFHVAVIEFYKEPIDSLVVKTQARQKNK